jgi:hypothetical protein
MPRKKDDWKDTAYEVKVLESFIPKLEAMLERAGNPQQIKKIKNALLYTKNTIKHLERSQKEYEEMEKRIAALEDFYGIKRKEN